ncbi:MAG TPA: 6-phosphogluconolactonase [Solirubrobacteraceae bacterium]|jgi:6-phosphogluconolactonase|nr:6-phosphogluconolactonase [Solirubrobacteraceae bacterium]
MRLTTVADAAAAASRAAEVLDRLLAEALRARGHAHLALSGGSSPRRAYELLGPRVKDWSEIELWFGDERCVEPEHPDSNYRMVAESLLAHAEVPSEQIHRMPGELGPDTAARVYTEELCSHVPTNEHGIPVLDVVLLGLGEDGHTASLFPGRRALEAHGQICVGVHDAPKPPPERVTLTLDTINAAHHYVLLAPGAGKADAVGAVCAGPDPHVPASLLRRGRLELIVDDAASPAPPAR